MVSISQSGGFKMEKFDKQKINHELYECLAKIDSAITQIPSYAIKGASYVVLPTTVTSIANNAFYQEEENTTLKMVGGFAYYKLKGVPYSGPYAVYEK